MTILLWVVLIGWIAALLRTIIHLGLLPRLRADAAPDGPLVSLVIPARNEEGNIERTIRSLLAQTYRSIELIVVEDRSTDATGAILARVAEEDARLRVISGSETPAGWLGKPWALHQGSEAATGEILLFVDADVVYERPAVAAAVAHLRASGASMLMLLPRIVMRSFWEWVAMPQLAMTVYSFFPTWLSNRTTLPVLGIGGGSGNMVWRSDYDDAGGYEALHDAVIDDVGMARLLRRKGRRTIVVRAEDFVSVRMYDGGRAVVEGFTKNLFAVGNRSYFWAIVGVSVTLLFHVLPYALALAGQVLAGAAVGIITLTRLILFAALGYRLDYAVWAHPLMGLCWSGMALRSMWITGVRGRLAWRGRSYDAARTRFGA
ncbi:MAG TPA: glycosyltransferase family 2 protein [Thermoanaerobaculia bacterium]|nr:glycosyltransferase family 2 protein [Thermoanaerobaculia bacterium]